MSREPSAIPPMTLLLGLLPLVGLAPTAAAEIPARFPNIVYILADDLGIGDVGCYNKESKIATPNLDRVAAEGMRFRDAHSGSSVCTPTRYGILTGRYAWRTRLKKGVLGGYSPPLIEPGRLTVPAFLKRHGYRTACVGKWHLGLDWATREPVRFDDAIDPRPEAAAAVDYALPFKGGLTALGFDAFFGISASLDMPPYLFLRGDRCEGRPTVEKTFIRRGPADKDFEAVEVLPTLAREALAFLDDCAREAPDRPFFLYFPLTAPHTPIVPSASFAGRGGLGGYGDFVEQVDATVGLVLDRLRRDGQGGRTLLIVTSDNGCSPEANFPALARRGHHPSGPYRGYKADIYEGGHRIPFLARWPGKVRPGATSDRTICLTDLLATCSAIVAQPLPPGAGEDSVSLLPALLEETGGGGREATVHHSINGSFAIRKGPWKLALCPDSGGWSPPRPDRPAAPASPPLPPVQLFNLADDPAERRNLEAVRPEVVAELTRLLERIVAGGRDPLAP